MIQVKTQPLTANAFAPFGDVLEAKGEHDALINQGLCKRYTDRAELIFKDARAGVSIFNAEPRSLPYRLDMMERHPLGSQCFIPMHSNPFLVIVAVDKSGAPDTSMAFITEPGQAINFHQNSWHGVLTPLSAPGLFAVVDRIGEGSNLQEHWFETPYEIL